MTNKEREMFELIRANPQISQNELAKKLNITRSSVSVHVTNLTKKGYISGRGYILQSEPYVTIIGAANMDIIGRSTDDLILEDSNPGSIELCAGGVGRNISENLARIGVKVKLISALGDDVFAENVRQVSENAGVDMSHCYIKSGGRSSTYIAILENSGEMRIALSDMSILDDLPVEHLAKKQQLIQNSDILVLDSGLPEATIEYIMANFPENRIFLDPVSIGKAKHVKRLISGIDTLKANRLEAEFLSDIPITGDDSLAQVGEFFISKGVKRLFLSLGKDGVYYKTADEEGIVHTPRITPVNATGAGDSFMAGIVHCSMQGKTNAETVRFASAMSRITLMSSSTVSPLMSLDNIRHEIENIK